MFQSCEVYIFDLETCCWWGRWPGTWWAWGRCWAGRRWGGRGCSWTAGGRSPGTHDLQSPETKIRFGVFSSFDEILRFLKSFLHLIATHLWCGVEHWWEPAAVCWCFPRRAHRWTAWAPSRERGLSCYPPRPRQLPRCSRRLAWRPRWRCSFWPAGRGRPSPGSRAGRRGGRAPEGDF